MAEYIRIGEPANEAEKVGFRLLRDQLPDHYLVLGNFDLRLPQRRTSLEFDAVVIGEYGFFAVEIKGWSGAIRGGADHWYLPWGRVSSPLSYLEKKTKALAQYIRAKVPDLPDDCFYAPALFFPRGNVHLDFPENILRYIAGPDGVYDFFVDMDLVHQKGPGPLRSRERSQAVVDAIVALAEPSERGVVLPYYDVEGELERPDQPYREFVGTHQYLKSRSKVRIKAYAMDGLASKKKLRREENRILRDIEALEVLNENPYVARSYEMQPDYKDELIFYLISEWVSSTTLAAYLQKACGRTSERGDQEMSLEADNEADKDAGSRRELARHLVQAVDTIHRDGIVHRNLNPQVIYLTADSSVPLKIADFDFARVRELESIADAFSRIGTDGYMAPELWLEKDYDHRVDLFSLGAILYEILICRPLFEGPGDILQLNVVWEKRGGLIADPREREVIRGLISETPEPRSAAMSEALRCFVTAETPDGE